MTRLADTLRALHAAITGAAPVESASGLVVDGGVPARDRLGVYAYAYTARIADVLVHDHPKLDALVGSLRPWVPAYLRAHPPAHPSLREVGASLARWLAAQGEPAHVVDLAALERARLEAFDGGADVTPLVRDDVAALAPEDFPGLRLRLVPSARVVTMTSNADELWDALEDERPAPAPAAAPGRAVVVWRRDVTVVHRTLEADEARVVPRLVDGLTFAAACEALADHPAPEARAVELLLRWLDAAMLASG